jgi:hypothetical protein
VTSVTAVKLMLAGASLAERRALAQSIGDLYPRGVGRGPGPEAAAARLIQLVQVAVEPDLSLLLYVVGDEPGFGPLWGVLACQMSGYAVLTGRNSAERLGFARDVLRAATAGRSDAARPRTQAPFVIGVTDVEAGDGAEPHQVVRALGDVVAAGSAGPAAVVGLDCADRESVKAVLCTLLRAVQQRLHKVGEPEAPASDRKGGTSDAGHAVAVAGIASPRDAGHRQPQH